LTSLTYLYLDKNIINSPGAYTFKSTNIFELIINNQNLKTLASNTFDQMSALTTLDLANNKIELIESNAISNCNKLISINLNGNSIKEILSNAFFNLKSLEILNLNKQSLTYLSNDSFNGLANLKNLTLNENIISIINKETFKGLNKLSDLQISNNKLTVIKDETFFYLNSLLHLSLSSNQIESIESNAFYYLFNLTILNLNNNKLKQIQSYNLVKLEQLLIENNTIESIVKVNSSDLRVLNLKSNKITKIESNSFNGLLKLKLIDLSDNPIIESNIDLNAFNNTNFKELRLTIPNMSIVMIHLLKDQLKPTIHHTAIIDYKLYSFYESIFIENRIDNDKEYCMKMMFLIKFKIYYNFIFENSDINNVETDECLDLIRVRDTFNRFNDTFQHIQYISKVKPEIDRLTHEIWTWIVFAIVTLVILYLYIQFEIYIKSINNQKRPKEIEMQEIVNEVVVDNNIEIPLQEAVEDIDDLNEIVTLDELVERKRTKIIDQDKKLSNKIIDKVTTNKEEINNLNDITNLDELID
jgi:Leucine-rich repeat (LRR) protein